MEKGSKSLSCFRKAMSQQAEIKNTWPSSVDDLRCVYDVASSAADSRLVGERRCWQNEYCSKDS